jgi:hypothetical protein
MAVNFGASATVGSLWHADERPDYQHKRDLLVETLVIG